jgi:Domain of unknown function (DUF4124)
MWSWQLRWRSALAIAALMTTTAGASAQTAAYKCVSRGTVLYSQVPCPGGREIGATSARTTDKWKTPPQDRATIAKRSVLSAEERQECSSLDGTMLQQKRMLKAKGDTVSIEDEMPLVRNQKRFRELRC